MDAIPNLLQFYLVADQVLFLLEDCAKQTRRMGAQTQEEVNFLGRGKDSFRLEGLEN